MELTCATCGSLLENGKLFVFVPCVSAT
ncbi:hypothetical protein ADUPG1_014845, partial [Aduncisulcus paluster]